MAPKKCSAAMQKQKQAENEAAFVFLSASARGDAEFIQDTLKEKPHLTTFLAAVLRDGTLEKIAQGTRENTTF